MSDKKPNRSRDAMLTRREVLKGAAAAGALVAIGGPLTAACGGSAGGGASPSATSGSTPKKGGNLRVGIAGGSTKETVDAHQIWGYPDQARCNALYDMLFEFNAKTMQPEPMLAESATPNEKGDIWTVRLKSGIEFHNGKQFTADDVIYSLQRILDKKTSSSAATTMSSVDAKNLKKVDKLTVEIPLKQPNAVFTQGLAEMRVKMVPVDYDPKAPVGTGPFKYKSFDPGERSLFLANTSYWGEGPYVDQVEVIDFKDDTSRVNALLSSAVDVIAQVPRAQSKAVAGTDGFAVVTSSCGNWDPFDMMADRAPFKDQRVREAFRLIADRESLVKLALSGYGRVANDMYSPYDPGYPTDLPQRTQDLEKAKSLLKAAGQEGLKVELVTSAMDEGIVGAAQVFAEQAKGAGVTVTIRKVDEATFWDQYYMDTPFYNEYWSTRNYLYQANLCTGKNAQWNTTAWDDSEWDAIVAEAWKTIDDAKRNELVSEAMTIEYDKGAFLVYGFKDMLDGHSNQVAGIRSNKNGCPLGDFCYQTMYFV